MGKTAEIRYGVDETCISCIFFLSFEIILSHIQMPSRSSGPYVSLLLAKSASNRYSAKQALLIRDKLHEAGQVSWVRYGT